MDVTSMSTNWPVTADFLLQWPVLSDLGWKLEKKQSPPAG